MNRASSRSAQRLANNCAFVHNRGHLRGGQVAHVPNKRRFQPRLKVLPADGGVQQGASRNCGYGPSTQTECAADGGAKPGGSNRQADRDERAGVRYDVFNGVDNRPEDLVVKSRSLTRYRLEDIIVKSRSLIGNLIPRVL